MQLFKRKPISKAATLMRKTRVLLVASWRPIAFHFRTPMKTTFVDGDHDVFQPDIINAIDNITQEWSLQNSSDSHSPTTDEVRELGDSPRDDAETATPTVRYFNDILNDDHCSNLDNTSDISINEAATITQHYAPPSLRSLDTLQPEPEPPPDYLTI